MDRAIRQGMEGFVYWPRHLLGALPRGVALGRVMSILPNPSFSSLRLRLWASPLTSSSLRYLTCEIWVVAPLPLGSGRQNYLMYGK